MTVDEIANKQVQQLKSWAQSAGHAEHHTATMDTGYIYSGVSPLYLTTKYRAFVYYFEQVEVPILSEEMDPIKRSIFRDFETREQARAGLTEMRLDIWRFFFL